jgi:hypothetical protein
MDGLLLGGVDTNRARRVFFAEDVLDFLARCLRRVLGVEAKRR